VDDAQDPDLVAGLRHYDAQEWAACDGPLRRAADRGNITAIFKLANALDRLGRESEAVELWQIACDQGHAGACNNVAIWLSSEGREDEAIVFYRRAAETGDVELMFNLAVKLDDAGQHDEARPWFDRAIAEGYPRAAAVLGNSLLERGYREEGLAILGQAVQMEHLSAAFVMAVDAQRHDDYDGIIEWCERALAMPEDEREAGQICYVLGMLGVGLTMAGRPQEALEPLERSIALGNESAQDVLDYARSLLSTSRPLESRVFNPSWKSPATGASTLTQSCKDCGEQTSGDGKYCTACGTPL